MSNAAAPKPGLDAFHRERSKCLDAFAACEEAITKLLKLNGIKSGSEPFGQRVEKLRKTKASPTYTKTRKQRVDSLLAELEGLMNCATILFMPDCRLP
jgi:hypothetical protein